MVPHNAFLHPDDNARAKLWEIPLDSETAVQTFYGGYTHIYTRVCVCVCVLRLVTPGLDSFIYLPSVWTAVPSPWQR